MPRITTDQPSSGKPLLVYVPLAVNGGFVGTDETELCEAPTFSVPATGDVGAVQDAANPNREVRGGEVFFETPLVASNATGTNRWVSLEMILAATGNAFEGGHLITTAQGGGASGSIYMTPRLSVTARLYNIATGALSTPSGVFASGQFVNSVQLSDGRIYHIPSSGTARIYNPATDTYTTPSGTFPNESHRCGVLLNDGKVFFPPFIGIQARIYDPVANTLTVAGGSYPLPPSPVAWLYMTAVKLADGKVFMAPWQATNAAIYDPATNSVTLANGSLPGFFSSCALLNDGKVFCNPIGSSVRPAIYDPTTNTLSYVSTNFPVTVEQGRWGIAMLSSGSVYIPAYSANSSLLYNPTTDTTTVAGGLFPGESAYKTTVLMPDGKVFLIPFNALEARVYDPVANTTTLSRGDYPTCAERITVIPQTAVPANGTVSLPIQGLRLLSPARTTDNQALGGRLVARAEVNNAIKVIGSATELEASDHAPNTAGI
jgi:hypothetical protein